MCVSGQKSESSIRSYSRNVSESTKRNMSHAPVIKIEPQSTTSSNQMSRPVTVQEKTVTLQLSQNSQSHENNEMELFLSNSQLDEIISSETLANNQNSPLPDMPAKQKNWTTVNNIQQSNESISNCSRENCHSSAFPKLAVTWKQRNGIILVQLPAWWNNIEWNSGQNNQNSPLPDMPAKNKISLVFNNCTVYNYYWA